MKSERITITLPNYVNKALKKAAEEDGISNSAQAALLIRHALGIRELSIIEGPITTKTGRVVATKDGYWEPSVELLTKS